MVWLLAVLTGVLGSLPLLWISGGKRESGERLGYFALGAIAVTLCMAFIYYLALPSLVWPLWGGVGATILIFWWLFGVCAAMNNDSVLPLILPAIGSLVLVVAGANGCNILRANDYANVIGEVEKREWTKDVQPKDPKHIRLVPAELALWLANKQLGEAPGAIGSQFQISEQHLTLQMIKGELWYVVPLDFKAFSVWTSAEAAPGYVMIHGEDPNRPVIVKFKEKFVYMPGAYFGKYLERHLWNQGYYRLGLTDYSFEIDEDGKAWWVVTVFKPTVSYWGVKAMGVVVVDPTNGNHTFYPTGQVPKWIDRMVPAGLARDYVAWRGLWTNGWWNSVWAHKDLTEPEDINLIYGSDGEPYWVINITSSNMNDEALVGLYYIDSRTGKTIFYHATGGTEEAVLKAVNNKVAYRRLRGASQVLYNIYGTMSAIVPLLGESHTFQGVAIVNVTTLQVAVGENQYVALREYQKELALSGQQIAPELSRDKQTLRGTVDRFASEVKSGGTMYYLHITGIPHLFTGASELSPKLPLTKVGDSVEIAYIASGEDVVPMMTFNNFSLPLKATANQQAVRQKTAERKEGVDAEEEGKSLRKKLENMTDEELNKWSQEQKEKK